MQKLTKTEAIEKLLLSYKRYYNITQDTSLLPFYALAEFNSHNEQYVLLKSAKIADIDSNEYVYFALQDELTENVALDLDQKAWQSGLAKVKPSSAHRNSDIVLTVIADKIDETVFKNARKLKHYKSYKFSFWGWSNYSFIAYELSTGKFAYNRRGKDLKKLFKNVEQLN